MTEERACQLLEAARWPARRFCPRCGSDHTVPASGAAPYRCQSCRRTFSVRTLTCMDRSRLPLSMWLNALLACARRIRPMALSRNLGVSPRTARNVMDAIHSVVPKAVLTDFDYQALHAAEPHDALRCLVATDDSAAENRRRKRDVARQSTADRRRRLEDAAAELTAMRALLRFGVVKRRFGATTIEMRIEDGEGGQDGRLRCLAGSDGSMRPVSAARAKTIIAAALDRAVLQPRRANRDIHSADDLIHNRPHAA